MKNKIVAVSDHESVDKFLSEGNHRLAMQDFSDAVKILSTAIKYAEGLSDDLPQHTFLKGKVSLKFAMANIALSAEAGVYIGPLVGARDYFNLTFHLIGSSNEGKSGEEILFRNDVQKFIDDAQMLIVQIEGNP